MKAALSSLKETAKRVARRLGLTRVYVYLVRGRRSSQSDIEIAFAQLHDAFVQAGGLPLPPPDLQTHVSGAYDPRFVKLGDEVLDDYEKILEPTGRTLSSFGRVLDFGCSVGRILRAYHFRRTTGQELYGSDIDAPVIDWCTKNYSFAAFSVNDPEPPTAYPDAFFDFLYANSVMTHLTEDSQFRWLAEFRRIVKPGGLLILTFAGDHCLNFWPLTDKQREQGKTGFLWTKHCTYHTNEYVRAHWSRYLEVIELRERSVVSFQDSALCRVPAHN